MSYLTDYEEIDEGYVAFGGNLKEGKITGKCTIKTSKLDFENGVAITPQQNRVAKRRNITIIKAAKTMLADSKLPTTFWTEAVNTACYVQNKVLVVKPHNMTPYELFHGRTPTLNFIKPFGCLVTILNTKDHIGKFDGKADEGFFIGYSLNSKAFRVFNNKTRVVEENLHIRFSKNTPNVVGTKASDNAWQAIKETKPVKYYILLPLWTANLLFSQDLKSSHDDGFKPLSDDEKKVDKDPRKENECNDQEKEHNVNNTNNVNTISLTVNDAGTNKDNELPFDPNMLALEDVSTFNFSSDDEDDEEPKMVIHALRDSSWIEAMQEKLLQFKLKEVWTLVDLPNGKRAIGTKWVFRNKKDERKIEEEVYVYQPPGVKDVDFIDIIYKIEKPLYGLQQAPKAWFTDVKNASTPMETQKPLLKDKDGEEVGVHMYREMIGSLMYLTSSRPDIMFTVCACARYQVNLNVSHLHAMKRIFKYLKGQLKLGLWYLKDSPFDLVAYTDSDYAGASLDKKSTT
uniref:Retrovirus-related Pol polyprotein from transposon TNT 1-94 n=1 Tax=Tanacetum cinerariifolium TaxID=118510 RepID=A0A699GLT6_TANCI|nr:retrovirus-related Pol polyprotein from transposon TNT 1-94 [Tanacetum cinerariifolium]